MEKNTHFDSSRLFNFIQRQAVFNMNTMLVGAGAIFGILLVLSIAIAYLDGNPDSAENLKGTYLSVFFLTGYVFTSRIFNELHSPQRSYAYLTLPVSTTEKIAGSWILSAPVFVLVYWMVVCIIYLITRLITGSPVAINELFDGGIIRAIGVYMVVQTIFFLGAVYFRNNNFLKTLFSLFVLVVVIGLYSGLLLWLFFGGNIDSRNFPKASMDNVWDIVNQMANIFFTYVLAPFMLIVTYFRLKERQV